MTILPESEARPYTIRNENPPPLSSLSLPEKIPVKSTAPKSAAC
jgi:hypothetical protein